MVYEITNSYIDEGIVGCDVMRRLRLLLDYPGGRAYVAGLEPPAGPAPFALPPTASLPAYSTLIYTPDGPCEIPGDAHASLVLPKGSTADYSNVERPVIVLPGGKRPLAKTRSWGK